MDLYLLYFSPISWFEKYADSDFARTGFKAEQTVTIPVGALPQFPHSMEPQLRRLNLPISLQKGVIHMDKEHTVCTEGDTLTPEQSQILVRSHHCIVTTCSWLFAEALWSQDG